MNKLRVVLSVLFVVAVSFFVVRSCVHKKPSHYEAVPKKIVKKKIAYKKVIPKKEPERVAVRPGEPVQGALMAIILDDWGNSFGLTKYALAIQRPLTLSVLPHLPQNTRIAEEAHNNGLGVMLHMPMQPKNQTKGLEPHTILLTTPDREIEAYLDQALESVPHAEGVNNHMGSAATSDLHVMNLVLRHLMAKGLFFVDSNTASTTLAPKVAKMIGIPFTKRDVFIDNIMTPEAIKKQLRRAERIALKHGRVIVIGHGRKMTLQVIKQMVPEIEAAGIRLVLVKDLV